MKNAIWIFILAFIAHDVLSQDVTISMSSKHIKRVFILNRFGDVVVKGKQTPQIKLMADATYGRNLKVSAARTKEVITIDTAHIEDGIVFYITDPRYTLRFSENDVNYRNIQENWKSWKNNPGYNYNFDITIELPDDVEIKALTHHDGDVYAYDMMSNIRLCNHHGNIYGERLGGNADINTHHGDIEVSFKKNPTKYGEFHTHHGHIKTRFADNLSADVSMESHHGEFYSEFDWSYAPIRVKDSSKKDKGKYMLRAGSAVRIGEGGPNYDFHTHHGDVYLLQSK